MKRTILTLAFATAFSTSAVNAADNQWEKEASDAWIDGKAEATLLFNGNLNSFDINTDVKNGVVVLTGKVDHSVDKKLATELLIGIDGVKEVDNRLTVVPEVQDKDDDGNAESDFVDAKIATVIKTRLLFDTDISGTDIDVDVDNQTVTLTGEVESDAEKQLVVNIATNADDVKRVNNKLTVIDERS